MAPQGPFGTYWETSQKSSWGETKGHEMIAMTPEDMQILFRVAQWCIDNKPKRVEKIRQLVGTEENYLILIKEIDRVDAQLRRARTLHAAATLTIIDWLSTLDHFDWQCAYCLSKPFQVMSHFVLLPHGGTTPDNCVPACYGCGRSRRQNSESVQAYLASVRNGHKQRALL